MVAFSSEGKQVLRNGEHYADAYSVAAAEAIAAALNAWARADL